MQTEPTPIQMKPKLEAILTWLTRFLNNARKTRAKHIARHAYVGSTGGTAGGDWPSRQVDKSYR